MTACYDEGALRAYLDGALPEAERRALSAHLAGCAACRGRAEEQHALIVQVATLLPAPQGAPDPPAALARLRAARGAHVAPRPADPPTDSYPLRRNSMPTRTRFWPSARRPLLAGLAALLVVVSLLALPPLRAAADQLLGVFRMQQVVFVPTNTEQLQRLKDLNFDKKTLFVATPHLVNKPAAPRTVASADAASGAAGFAVQQPTVFPNAPTSTRITVRDRSVFQFQVDVAAARQLLTLMEVDDVTLPDSLGATPITADMPAAVETRYSGNGYEMTLLQGRSPALTLPDGVDLRQLGKAALRLLGMDPGQAELMSRQIDWSSTLIFPFPTDLTNMEVRQVTIGDVQGLMVHSTNEGRAFWGLYWQRGDRIYVLQGQGRVADYNMIATAESIG